MEDSLENGSRNSLTNHLTNYLPWARAMEVAIGGRGKWKYVDGTKKYSDAKDDAGKSDWKENDLKVMSWIFNSIKPKIYEQFAYAPSSHSLWVSIKEMYGEVNNSSRVFELQQSIIELKQGEMTAIEYLGEMKKLWDEIEQYRPKADSVATYETRESEDKIFRVLANLSPEYEDVRREILIQEKMPTYTTVCAIIQRAETQGRVMKKGKVSSQNTVETSAHFTSNSKAGNGNRKGGSKFYYDYCRKTGHTRERCYVMHPELKPKYKSEGQQYGNKTES